ncbi:16S rRNA (guanine(966)-N(2))-methyltransferase RsmD [Pantoea sp. Aalb]|uniref:16S rRNA (guanine(966)-N(2))-methyltransferase RsmD n=1 Tax=Pantoea sp. Aalb TaxID=2576762 RepID=UPI00132799A2|nr:16S rRNA (guanine(966)-N(2))-methyltransferase RsmD [Pantoea sp. Aalb]MXP67789.1 16S rRNA (guanine(966)-N(2))-methyltransferase RsmD [Pantoea sp. Aalb]
MSKYLYNRNNFRQIRLIGGRWRGHKLLVLNHIELRPTGNRLRETLFNWLSPYIEQAHCLDCFAGTGALGLEALSRYASSATLLELNFQLVKQIKKKLKILNTSASEASVLQINTIKWLNHPSKVFDIVFVDPPFYKGLLNITIQLLEQKGWLSDEALIYVESTIKASPPIVPINWFLYRKKIFGQVYCSLYKRHINIM